MRLRADVNKVAGKAREAALAVRRAAGSLRLRKVIVQLVDCILKRLPVQL